MEARRWSNLERMLKMCATYEVCDLTEGRAGRSYRSTRLPERRAMMQAWADYLDGLRAG